MSPAAANGCSPAGRADSGGRVWLIGAGPGDPELITVKAVRLLAQADVVIYDRLVNPALLDYLAPHCQRYYVGKAAGCHALSQGQIERLMIDHARQGARVCRLKGGDPLIFGRGGEEMMALFSAGIPFEVVPGITAAMGCAAASTIPLTHRHSAQAVTFVTGHSQEDRPYTEAPWESWAGVGKTLVLYMALNDLGPLTAAMLSRGVAPELAAAIIENGTTPHQRVVPATLATLAEQAQRAQVTSPALVILGEVVQFHPLLAAKSATPAAMVAALASA